MSDLKERTDALITQKSFSICSCPINTIQEFKDFCITETQDNYAMGLKLLLERNKYNLQFELLHFKLTELEARFDSLNQTDKKEEIKPKAVRTFGQKGG